MALAIAEYQGTEEGVARFWIDIGTNRFYAYAIGDAKSDTPVGDFTVLGDVTTRSPLIGPVPEAARGRAVLAIPERAFDDGHRAVQITSYREESLAGPTVSDPVLVRKGGDLPGGLPEITFGVAGTQVRRVRCPGMRQPYANGMFAWLPLIEAVAPSVLDLVGKLIAPKPAAAPAPAQTTPTTPPPPPASQDELIKLVTSIVQKVIAGAGATADGAKADAKRETGESESLAVFSEAQVFPIAAVAALAPLLEKVLTPETIKTLANTADPNRLIGTISNAVLDFAKIGLKANEDELDHLRQILPTTGPAADELLKDMSLSLASGARSTDAMYRRIPEVRLHFADLSPQLVAGRPQCSFRNDRDLSFPLAIETPKLISDARVLVRVKDAASLATLAKRDYRVPSMSGGRLDVVPKIPLEDATRLAPGHDYLVHVTLLWRTRKGERIGTSVAQLISIVGDYSFDRVEPSTEIVALNDSQTYRDFWHKAWQGTLDHDHRRVTFNCRYAYALDVTQPTNAQMETRTHVAKDLGFGYKGTLDSGLVMSLYRLNDLVGRLPGGVSLDEAELAGLATPAFADRFNQAARQQVRFNGRDGDSVALWVFPEVKLDTVVLRHAEVVNDAGHVLRFGEQRFRFPMPALAHFIGVRSQ